MRKKKTSMEHLLLNENKSLSTHQMHERCEKSQLARQINILHQHKQTSNVTQQLLHVGKTSREGNVPLPLLLMVCQYLNIIILFMCLFPPHRDEKDFAFRIMQWSLRFSWVFFVHNPQQNTPYKQQRIDIMLPCLNHKFKF